MLQKRLTTTGQLAWGFLEPEYIENILKLLPIVKSILLERLPSMVVDISLLNLEEQKKYIKVMVLLGEPLLQDKELPV